MNHKVECKDPCTVLLLEDFNNLIKKITHLQIIYSIPPAVSKEELEKILKEILKLIFLKLIQWNKIQIYNL